MKNDKPIKIISLFSGCGGMDLGFVGGFKYLGNDYTQNQGLFNIARDGKKDLRKGDTL
tara:strand:+ start:7604 stop:7777 length:174 start_codon:yes stop_codon:yes gene_type:complete